MSKPFLYRFADGSEIETADMTNAFLDDLIEQHGECVFNGYLDHIQGISLLRANSHKKKTDGFQPGWHPGLNMEIRTNGQYQAELKARGMVEVGNEKPSEKKKENKSYFDEQSIREIRQMGGEVSDREADKLLGKAE
jgi:hypothetical protein